LHQGKRLLIAWSYISRLGDIQTVLVRWNEDMQDFDINRTVLQMQDTKTQIYDGPDGISGDGNWLHGIRKKTISGVQMDERVVFHLQDYYPQGISMPVSLGYTNQDPGAFMNHSKLGPCYVEQNTNRNGILFIFKLNDAVDIIKRQALEATSGLTEGR
jgi:hypothetical protein